MATSISSTKKKKSPIIIIFLCLILLTALIGVGVFVFFENEKPVIALSNDYEYIGPETNITFTITDRKTGLQDISLTLIQGSKEKTLHSTKFPRNGFWLHAGPEMEQVAYTSKIKKLGFKDGPAKLIIEAHDYSFRGFLGGNATKLQKEIIIDTTPPKINILHSERYIEPGGSGFVIYRLSDDAVEHGVTIGNDFHPGFLVGDGRDDVYNCLFGLPYSTKEINNTSIIATDRAGNRAIVPFSPRLRKARQKQDRINIGDSFLKRKIPELEQHYPEMEGSLIEKYLYVNNSVRMANNKTIATACTNSDRKRLWKGRFLRMAGSSRAGFADHRTYFYKGKAVDKQVHLGMDIASTKRIGIKAAGTGKVIFTEYLGIYGNTIILDHGQGLFSLYAHLSQINVALDDMVEKGTLIALSGATGMAGGDHLHFSMLVNGIFVTPKEWWDQHWIDVTIEEPLIDSKF